MSQTPQGGKPSETSGEHAHGRQDVFAPDAHGEELREYAQGDWQHEVGEFFKHLNQMMSKVSGGPGGVAHSEKSPSMKHPLVLAAVITTCVTAGSSLLLHLFQNREAANQRTNELYKSKIEFVTSFGDAFPKSLNALYSNMKELIWLKCFPVSYALDEDAASKTVEEAEAFKEKQPDRATKAKQEHRAEFDDSYKSRVQEKKLTTLCAQAMAMFGHEEGADIRALLKCVRAIQDVADDPPDGKFKKMSYRELESGLETLHNEANDLFARVLETLGNQLGDTGPRR